MPARETFLPNLQTRSRASRSRLTRQPMHRVSQTSSTVVSVSTASLAASLLDHSVQAVSMLQVINDGTGQSRWDHQQGQSFALVQHELFCAHTRCCAYKVCSNTCAMARLQRLCSCRSQRRLVVERRGRCQSMGLSRPKCPTSMTGMQYHQGCRLSSGPGGSLLLGVVPVISWTLADYSMR